ncbi:thiamine-phosphate kinase [Salipaludibacillus sp. LMS25]|jgi:thiamine-monophosphate kinase|uniref:thiamine-phosphate kinase n=1 Tax=Salipaludibacillus sp. LMS25 TaxID=2924031 RepID=UPI0020D071B7|nr:thiamine-phosphate kinase [Salipaludibacillus sp. LMS25]UTR13433.1 thiamine-phosphate kinase [Salipaludibacillus sp. LMS25]
MADEFEWIRSIAPARHFNDNVQVGIGDDAAIVANDSNRETILTVDTMVEDIHFKRRTMPLHAIGHKALAANLSDIAAMGGVPRYYLVSIAVPKHGWSQDEITEIYRGLHELADTWHVDLIGGDTVSTSQKLVLTVTVIGTIESGRRLLRANAKEGDVVFMTGPAGMAAYGLAELSDKGLKANEDATISPFIQAHQYPVPKIEAGRLLAESRMRIALNDISDGLAHEAKEIAEASGVNITIDWDKLPLSKQMTVHPLEKQMDWVLYGGEDFQLIGTVSQENSGQLANIFKTNGLSFYLIGDVIKGEGQVYIHHNGQNQPAQKAGYHHF